MKEKQKLIFLVDDDITNLKVGKKALSGYCKVLTFSSGPAMLEAFGKSRPDLILLDISMPAMNGYEVLKELENVESSANIPIIFLTALSDKREIIKGISLGPSDYITKPFLPDHLLERVKAHLEGQ